ncbi:MAG: hypothetical protein M1825_002239 [Sarcosagium campestre]|nr:MAG: hypothetical protein M1825_002239 [Sarcosagium campestre]
MSLSVYIAHSGRRLHADPLSFATLDALRLWISREAEIQPPNQILMTNRGKQVKLQTLLTEGEIFVYDRKLISPPSTISPKVTLSKLPVPASYNARDPPDTLTSPIDLQAWQELFKARRSWALEVAEQCPPASEAIRRRYQEVEIIDRAVAVAVSNLETHVKLLEHRHNDARTWATQIVAEHETTLSSWEALLEKLSKIPIKREFLDILSLPSIGSRPGASLGGDQSSDRIHSLGSFVGRDEVKRAATVASTVSQQFQGEVEELGRTIEDITSQTQRLGREIRESTLESGAEASEEAARLMEDILVVAKKVSSDYEHVLTLPPTSKSVSQVSKMALLNTRNYLPSLSESSLEMSQSHQRAVEQRNNAAEAAIQHLQTVSSVESQLAIVNPQFAALSVSPEGLAALELLTTVSKLPHLYGSLLVESVRRREWADKLKIDSSALAEELAGYKEEEERRRRKWHRNLGDFISIDLNDSKALGVEVNLQGDEEAWPLVTRKDLAEYLDCLTRQKDMAGAYRSVSLAVSELDKPTRQQARRAKAFKQGSIHEASLGRSTLLLRGESDAVQALRDANASLEDKLKGSESRVRKLEDLVHRHSQLNRTPTGNGFQSSNGFSPEQHATSPRAADGPSHQPSFSSRRYSANQVTEERALARRIVSLEAELNAEREQRMSLQKEQMAREAEEKAARRRLEEADSTKRDLMDNLEAQQREFSEERKLLDRESGRLKAKLEEVEDELDRLLGSRENEKMDAEGKFSNLAAEIEVLKRTSSTEIEAARTEAEQHRTRAGALDAAKQTISQQHDALISRLQDLERDLGQRKERDAEHRTVLQAAYCSLSPDTAIPTNISDIAEGLEMLAEKASNHLRDVENALAVAHADNEELRRRRQKAEAEVSAVRDRLGCEEMESFRLRETLASERGRASAKMAELEEERSSLRALRSQFLDGQSGSKALQDRVDEEQRRVSDLSTTLAAAEKHNEILEKELHSQQEKIDKMQSTWGRDVSRLESRGTRAKDLTQRLYTQNDRLSRLLESLGFSVSRRDGSMIIQRVSRAATSSTTEDLTTSMNRSGSGTIPTRKALEDSADLDLLYWMRADDSETESDKFTAYLDAVGSFDVEAFSETIFKRVKETEHMARKWQKEARGYRDKAHRAQVEAHEKIAYRSFKEGDLALFLPTRNQATRPWAAFNVGAPHYFLREQDSHRLRARDWLLARISKVEERVVDLSRSMQATNSTSGDRGSIGESSDGGTSFVDDENPFELSDGLRWYLLSAAEEKPGAPTTPGLGKSTVASAHVDARGSIRVDRSTSKDGGASKRLSKSLDTRRDSSNSKKSSVGSAALAPPMPSGTPTPPKRHSLDGEAAAAAASAVAGERQSGSVGSYAGPALAEAANTPIQQSVEGDRRGEGGGGPDDTAAAPDTAVASASPAAAAATQESILGFDARRPPFSSASASAASASASSKSIITRTTQQQQQQQPQERTQRAEKGLGHLWDSLWSVDMSYESGKNGGRGRGR